MRAPTSVATDALEDVEGRLEVALGRPDVLPVAGATWPYRPSPTRRGKTSRSIDARSPRSQQRRAPSARARTTPAEMLFVSIWSGAGFSTNSRTDPSSVAAARARRPTGPRPGTARASRARPSAACAAQLGGDVDVGQHVAVEHQEPLVEHVLGELQRAARAQRPRLLEVAQAQADRLAVAQHGAHAGGHVPARHHDVVDAVRAQPVEHERDERPVDQRDDRLRHRGGQRPQPRALATGEDERLHSTSGLDDVRRASAARPIPS